MTKKTDKKKYVRYQEGSEMYNFFGRLGSIGIRLSDECYARLIQYCVQLQSVKWEVKGIL